MATLTFPSPTQLKNISGPTDGSDAATKTYVDSQLSDHTVSAAGSNTEIQFNSANSFSASSNFTFNSATSILTVTGNIVSSNANLGNAVVSNYFIGNGSLLTGLTATTASTVTSNAQANITSVGTLTGLTVSGNVAFSGANVSLGNVSNLHITGGTSGYFLTTDGSGGLSWAAQTALTATVDEFTANGTYTTFTLSTTPSSENVTMVAVQGVLQPKSSYSLMGPQLTFDAAPPASAFIEVTTFSGGGGGAGGGGGEALSALYRAYTGDGVANTFTVTSGVTANSVLVAENGILQRPTTDYTIAGSTLTLVTTPADGVDIQIRELSGGGGSSSPALTWNIASSNATMVANNGYFVDTSGGAKTMTLPTSATLGDTIRINDLAGTFSTYNLTVARNGHKIQGIADNLLVDADQSSFGLVYSNSTYGWKVLEL